MTHSKQTTIWRIKDCKKETGYSSNSSIYNQIREGLFPASIPLGTRAVGWPANEVQAVCAARIAGANDDAIKTLVQKLHAKRSELLPQI